MASSISSCSPSNKTEDIKGQEEYGKGSEGDKEQHDSKTPPSPDGQTGLKHTNIKKFNTLLLYMLIILEPVWRLETDITSRHLHLPLSNTKKPKNSCTLIISIKLVGLNSSIHGERRQTINQQHSDTQSDDTYCRIASSPEEKNVSALYDRIEIHTSHMVSNR